MHRNIIPTQMQSARAERPVRLDPFIQNSFDDGGQCRVQLWKTVTQQQAQIDALCAVIKFAFVNGQARRLRKRLWQSISVKEILQVIVSAFRKPFQASLVPSK